MISNVFDVNVIQGSSCCLDCRTVEDPFFGCKCLEEEVNQAIEKSLSYNKDVMSSDRRVFHV